MGKILKIEKITTLMESIILGIGLAVVLTGVYLLSPGLRVSASKMLSGLKQETEVVNNIMEDKELPLPSKSVSSKIDASKKGRIAEYAWNGNAGCIAANGGPNTTSGSLMESLGVNLEIVRQDKVGELRNMLVAFTKEFDGGVEWPRGDKTAFAVSVMGDGNGYLVSTTQEQLDKIFGKGKYHIQILAPIGLSDGEDKLIGLPEWKKDPQTMRGAVISSVIGDGDYILAVNFAFANKLNVNPDPTTYDANAVNFVASQDDDYINSVKELIASQIGNYTVPLKEVVNGKLTGKTLNKKITGATTWSPGDRLAFDKLTGYTDVISTKTFNNQMATTIVGIKEWCVKNDKYVTNLLKATYTAGNQIKQYDTWLKFASEAVCKTYNFETPKYWYDMFKGYTGTKNGIEYSIGGSRVFNLADAEQYMGLNGQNNRYKSVYEQVATYLVELNPCDFKANCKSGVVPYDDAVNMYFLKSIKDVNSGKTEQVDYTAEKTNVVASGNWSIQFNTGSSDIQGSSNTDLKTVYNLLTQAENTKVSIIGHTDNVGSADKNLALSKERATSVSDYLISLGVPRSRFQVVDGRGQDEPLSDNTTPIGKSKNRRVQIKILN